MVQVRREAAELLRTQTLIQATRTVDEDSGETVKKAYESYIQQRAPFLMKQIEDQDKEMLGELRKWTRSGPMMVKAVKQPSIRSRLLERTKNLGSLSPMRKAS